MNPKCQCKKLMKILLCVEVVTCRIIFNSNPDTIHILNHILGYGARDKIKNLICCSQVLGTHHHSLLSSELLLCSRNPPGFAWSIINILGKRILVSLLFFLQINSQPFTHIATFVCCREQRITCSWPTVCVIEIDGNKILWNKKPKKQNSKPSM